MNVQERRACAVAIDPRRFLLLCLLVSLVFAHAMAGAASCQVLRISEVLCGPLSDWDHDGELDTKADEWVEIVNDSSETVSLEHYFLRDGTGDAYHYGFTGTLIPGQARVVTGTHALIWQASNGGGTSGLSLNNTGERVELWYDDGVTTPLLIDVVDVPPHAAIDDRAYAFDFEHDVYVIHDGLSPYSGNLFPGGNGCPPSPGVMGTCDTGLPVETQSWGEVKVQFES